jgi:DNA-binding NarL/FixJ family response regulator
LTAREIDVLLLVGAGLSNPAIAERLCISPHTLRHHIAAIYTKLELSTRWQILRYAWDSGLVPGGASPHMAAPITPGAVD